MLIKIFSLENAEQLQNSGDPDQMTHRDVINDVNYLACVTSDASLRW